MLDKLNISALMANCSSPESIGRAMGELVATGRPCGGYANAFTFIPLTYTPGKTRDPLSSPAGRAAGAPGSLGMRLGMKSVSMDHPTGARRVASISLRSRKAALVWSISTSA